MSRSKFAAGLLSVLTLLVSLSLGAPAVQAKTKGEVGKPVAITGAVAHVRGTSADLDGTVLPGTQTTSYFFKYGPTTAYGSQTTPGSLPPGTTRVKVGQAVTGLLPGYHYRIFATSLAGTAEGKDRVFTSKTLKSRLTLVKPAAPNVFGSPVAISGTLSGTGNANRKIVLQASPYPYLTSFSSFGLPITTNAAGAFVFHVTGLTSSTQFRVATLDPRPSYSPVVSEQIAVRVTLKVRTSSRKGLVRLYGTVSPAEVGASVLFQLRKPVRPSGKSERTTKFSTQFSSVVKRGSRTTARFSAIVEARHSGRYRAYVEVKKGPIVSGSSSTVVLSAAPTSKKH
jgi:hypothetical protein